MSSNLNSKHFIHSSTVDMIFIVTRAYPSTAFVFNLHASIQLNNHLDVHFHSQITRVPPTNASRTKEARAEFRQIYLSSSGKAGSAVGISTNPPSHHPCLLGSPWFPSHEPQLCSAIRLLSVSVGRWLCFFGQLVFCLTTFFVRRTVLCLATGKLLSEIILEMDYSVVLYLLMQSRPFICNQ